MIAQSRSFLFVQSAILKNKYFVLLQLLFVLVTAMFIVNNVLAKPLYLKNMDGKLGLFEREAELEHLPVNETSQSREKRDIVEGLRKLCRGTHRVSSEPASGCVQTWLYCTVNGETFWEPQCASQSTSCLHSITRFGFPKCKPVYRWMQITLRNGQKKILKLNNNCVCA